MFFASCLSFINLWFCTDYADLFICKSLIKDLISFTLMLISVLRTTCKATRASDKTFTASDDLFAQCISPWRNLSQDNKLCFFFSVAHFLSPLFFHLLELWQRHRYSCTSVFPPGRLCPERRFIHVGYFAVAITIDHVYARYKAIHISLSSRTNRHITYSVIVE